MLIFSVFVPIGIFIFMVFLIFQVECDNSLSMKKEEERNDNDEVHGDTPGK